MDCVITFILGSKVINLASYFDSHYYRSNEIDFLFILRVFALCNCTLHIESRLESRFCDIPPKNCVLKVGTHPALYQVTLLKPRVT